jgi:hypothetical protein
MNQAVVCPNKLPKRNVCRRTIFDVTPQFQGGVIIRCRKCGSYLEIHSATNINVLLDYEPSGTIVFNLETTCDPRAKAASVQPENKNEG